MDADASGLEPASNRPSAARVDFVDQGSPNPLFAGSSLQLEAELAAAHAEIQSLRSDRDAAVAERNAAIQVFFMRSRPCLSCTDDVQSVQISLCVSLNVVTRLLYSRLCTNVYF